MCFDRHTLSALQKFFLLVVTSVTNWNESNHVITLFLVFLSRFILNAKPQTMSVNKVLLCVAYLCQKSPQIVNIRNASCLNKYHEILIPNYNQQDATFLDLFISTNGLRVSGGSSAHHQEHITIYTKLRGLSPRANYTDRATAAGWRS